MTLVNANNPWIRVHSGKRFHLLNPKPSEMDIQDVAWSLSHQNRFYGHTKRPYSTAEHCCRACDIVADEFKFPTLMHDAGEVFCGDVSSKLKALLPDYKRIEKRIEEVVAKKWKMPFPFPPEVKRADLIMLATELRDLVPHGTWNDLPYKPLTEKIVPWSPEKARQEFLKRFHRLYK